MRKQGRRRAIVLPSSCSSIAGMNGAAQDVAKQDKTVGYFDRCYGFVSRFVAPRFSPRPLLPLPTPPLAFAPSRFPLAPSPPASPSSPPFLPVSEVSPRLPRLALSAFPRVLVETSSRSCCVAVPAFQCHEVPVGGLASSVVPVCCFSCHATICPCQAMWRPAPTPCPPFLRSCRSAVWGLLRPVPGLALSPAFSA